MAEQEVTLLKGNEAIAHAAIVVVPTPFSVIPSPLRVRLSKHYRC